MVNNSILKHFRVFLVRELEDFYGDRTRAELGVPESNHVANFTPPRAISDAGGLIAVQTGSFIAIAIECPVLVALFLRYYRPFVALS